jgi:DNA-binding transcriptional ArsR family regulator
LGREAVSVSVKVSSWVWHGDECSELMGNELVLMLALADVAGDEGRCRFLDDESGLTYDSLAQKVRVDRRTIERLTKRLRDAGLIEQKKGVKGRPNEFRIVVPWVKKLPDNLSGNASAAVQDSPTPATFVPLLYV